MKSNDFYYLNIRNKDLNKNVCKNLKDYLNEEASKGESIPLSKIKSELDFAKRMSYENILVSIETQSLKIQERIIRYIVDFPFSIYLVKGRLDLNYDYLLKFRYDNNLDFHFAYILEREIHLNEIVLHDSDLKSIFIIKAENSMDFLEWAESFAGSLRERLYICVSNYSNYKIYKAIKTGKFLPKLMNIKSMQGFSRLFEANYRVNGTFEIKYGNYLNELDKDNKKDEAIDLSIVIPVHNSRSTILECLKFAIRSLDSSSLKSEIIIVDDGSHDGSRELVEKFLNSQTPSDSKNDLITGDLNQRPKLELTKRNPIIFKYICLERNNRDSMNGNSFRAGQVRNVGAVYSRGGGILFIDSDIIINGDLIAEIAAKLNHFCLMMPKRINILKDQFKLLNDQRKKPNFLQFIQTDWGFLQDVSVDWNLKKNKWKYVCSYCLFVNREAYFKVKGFDNLFDSYGYEDTDLGYKLQSLGCEFKLLSSPVYHLTNYLNSFNFIKDFFNKRIKMQRSARYFFLKHLDPLIFEELMWLWGGAMDETTLNKWSLNFKGFIYASKIAMNRIYKFLSQKYKSISEVNIG